MKSQKTSVSISAQSMHHLGIVSGMIDKVSIVEMIDNVIPPDKRSKLTTGECVKVLLINSFGFTGQPLYLAADFFRNKPVDILIKKEIKASDINDDVLGRALDKLYNVNPTLLFTRMAYRIAKHFGIDTRTVHMDTSSKIMFGSYV